MCTIAQDALRNLFLAWGLDRDNAGSPEWNPLGCWIKPGSRVVLKPNWVLHWNRAGHGLECLVTNAGVIEAVLEYVRLARPESVILGDAPVQGCDIHGLWSACGIPRLVDRFCARGLDLSLVDFRRTLLPDGKLGDRRIENSRGREHFVLFDLGRESLLEELAADAARFRVTMYPPEWMQRTHAPGRHQYLVAREVIEADVVLNLPKLKTHKKAGVTGALKNLIGINGNKEYLPHHRKGGGDDGGDCYAGSSWLKARAEDLLDAANRRPPGRAQSALALTAATALRCARVFGDDSEVEGAWFGNDTIWRTCLDLQRILRYGTLEGTLAATPQRHVISVTDAIIGGEGEGPLASTPVPSGFLTGAANPAAADWVHARLMGFDPSKIPVVARAFDAFPYALVDFLPEEIAVHHAGGKLRADEVYPLEGRAFRPPAGWKSHCELNENDDLASCKSTVVV